MPPQAGAPSRAARVLRFPLVRLLIALAVLRLLTTLLSFARRLLPGGEGAVELVFAAAAIGALVFVGKVIERRPLAEIGLRLAGAPRELAAGFGLGALLMALVIGLMVLAGWYRIEQLGGAPAALFEALGFFLLVAVGEEVVTRGLIFRIVEEWLGSGLALAVSALVFGLLHLFNPHSGVLAAIAIALEAGILLGAAFMLTRSLWLAIGMHWSWNFVEGPVFGTPVSGWPYPGAGRAVEQGPDFLTGGGFGPEAGLIAVVVCGGAGAILIRRSIVAGHFATPPWLRSLVHPDAGPPAA